MDHAHLGVNPEMVTLARESRGITQAELATLIGVTQGALSKIEAGAVQASDSVLLSLCETLDYPREFFFTRGRLFGPSTSEFFHRKRATVPAKLLARVHAQLNIRNLQLAHMKRSVDIDLRFPHHDPEEFEGDISEVARAVRAAWQLPRGPVRNLVSAIEAAGGVIFRMAFGTPKLDAVSWWVPGGPPMFALNDSLPADRERWTLAHELGHLIMHTAAHPDMEDQADLFASSFLMPEEDIRSELMEFSLHKAAALKPRWRASMQALLMRAKQLGAITEGSARYLWSELGRSGYRTREPAELDFAKEQVTLLQSLVDAHVEELEYSMMDLKKVLLWNEREIREHFAIRGDLRDDKAKFRLVR